MRTNEKNVKRTPSPDNAEHKENSQTMKKIYYSAHNVHPRAVLASQNENGSWTVENEAEKVSVALNEDGFRYAYRDEPRDGENWLTDQEGFGAPRALHGLLRTVPNRFGSRRKKKSSSGQKSTLKPGSSTSTFSWR